jgi:transposase-like protein
MSESKVTLSRLVGQAWGQLQGTVLEEIRKRVEELAEAQRESLLGRDRHVRRRGPLRRWGYRVRKVLLTPWGMISGLRLPRIRDVEAQGEVAFLSAEGQEARLAEMVLASTLGGMSYRKVVNWARRHLGAVISADWVGRVLAEAAARIEDRRQERFSPRAFEALVVDGVWVHYRRSPRRRERSGVLLVAMGLDGGGGFRVLDGEVATAERAEAYAALFQRLYARGLEEVPLIVADGCGSVSAAAQIVYPRAQLQPCLRHWAQGLQALLSKRTGHQRRRFRRDFWWIYEADSLEQAERWALHFVRRWARAEPARVHEFWRGWPASVTFLRSGLQPWSYRLKTTNLAEGFFRNLRRFLGRFPGFTDPAHSQRALGLYLLGAEMN